MSSLSLKFSLVFFFLLSFFSSSTSSTANTPKLYSGYNSNANPSLQYEPRSGIITRAQNNFAARPGEGRHRLNGKYNPNGVKTRGVWDEKRQKFSAQETTPGPKKFREDIETLKIEKKPRDVIAHPHVEKKFWPTSLKNSVVAFGRSESGKTKPVGKGTAAAARDGVGEDDDGEGEEREEANEQQQTGQAERTGKSGR